MREGVKSELNLPDIVYQNVVMGKGGRWGWGYSCHLLKITRRE